MFSSIEILCVGFGIASLILALVSKHLLKKSRMKKIRNFSKGLSWFFSILGLFLVFLGIRAGLSSLLNQISEHLVKISIYETIIGTALVLTWLALKPRKRKIKIKLLKKSKKKESKKSKKPKKKKAPEEEADGGGTA